MADIRISQLPELEVAPADSDVLVINDVSVSSTKSITFGNLLTNFSKLVTDSATGFGGTGDGAKVTGDFFVANELQVGGDLTMTGTLETGTLKLDTMENPNGASIESLDNIRMDDNLELRLGTGNDMKIYHDGDDSFIDEGGTGGLRLRTNTGIAIRNKVSDKNYFSATRSGVNGGKARLWYQQDLDGDGLHDGEDEVKLETYDSGVNIFSFANTRRLRINNEGDAPAVPAAATDEGQIGEIRWDANHIYIYVAANTWKRVAISTWS